MSRWWRLSEVIRAEETQLPPPMWGHSAKMEVAALLGRGTSLAGTLILGIQSPELGEVSVTQSVEFRYGSPSWLTIWCLPLSIFLKWNLCVGEGTSATWNFLRIVGFLLSFVSMSLFILNWMHKFFNESTIVCKLEAGNKKNKNLAKVLSSE